MAVTWLRLTVMELAGTLPSIKDAEAQRLLAVATVLVEKYAPDAPDAVQNEAVIRTSGYLHGQPKDAVRAMSVGSISADFAPSRQAALRHSGAMSLLSPWKIRRAGAIG